MDKNENISEEYGDLLFSVVSLGRHLSLNPETVLADATDKFIKRFAEAERLARLEGSELSALSAQKIDVLWKKAKQKS